MPTNNAPVIHTATLDIVTANLNSSNVSVLLGNGAGGFTGNTTGLAGGTFPESVALGDVNGDGKLDIVTANFSDSASVLLGDGLGGFTASITRVADGTFPGSVALGDLNGDGKLDIVMANGRGNTISVLLGDGLGGFTASTTGIGNGGGPNSAALGDVNQDGRLDIVTPNFFSSNVSVLLGDGVGGFTASTTGIAGGNSPDSLALGHLNQDGRLDIVTANARSNNVSVLLANGAGGFTASTTGIAGGTDPRSVALGDVNADGKLDIITVNEVSNDVSVLLADGAGGFTASTTGIGGGTDPVSVALGDVNGDGKLDIVTANLESNNVSVLVGDGLGGFTASTIGIAGGVRPPSVALGDITDLRTVAEDTDLALTGISLSDVDASGPETLTLTVAHGTLAFGTTTGLTFAAGHDNGSGSLQATGTLADLNAALATLTYRGVQDYNGPDTLSLTLNDNDASGALQASAAVPIIVTPVNDAPVLDANASPALGAVSEDATLPQDGQQVGTLVSDLVRIGGNVSDPDVGAVTGIAVTATNSAHGTWFYSIDNGAHWALMGGVSDISARVLAADSGTRIYFAPDADFNGTLTDGITFRAWDQSDLRPNGSGGVNTSPNGGASAFSSAVDTASITINAVADIAPDVLVTDEDTAQTINVLANDNFNDPGRQVTSVTQGGHGSVTFLPGGEVTYTPNADYNGSDLFSYVVTSGGVTETANVSVTVNTGQDAFNDSASTNEETPVTIDVLANDVFADAGRELTSFSSGANGTVTRDDNGTPTLADDKLIYTPNANFNGTDSFTYTVTPPHGTAETATVNVAVVNSPPTVTAGTADHDLIEAVPFDPGQDTATVTLTKGDVDGTASYDAVALAGDNWTDNHDGTFSKQGAFGAATLHTATDTVTYLLDNNLADSLNDGDAPTETFTVHVTDGSLPATADAVFTVDGRTDFVSSQNGLGINEFPADGTVVGAVAAQGGGGTFTYSLLDDFGGAFAIDDTGTIRVVDGLKLDFEQNPTIDLTVHRTDTTSGQSSDQVFTVTLNDVNVENITGDGDANTFFGGAFGDRLDGAGGNDVLRGNGGNNTLAGGAGFDTADYGGAPGGVYFDFGEGKAFFNGFGGTDMVSGFESFVGSAQGDVIGSGAGNHTIDGAGGNDAVSYANAPTAVSVDLAAGTAQNGFGGTDTLLHMETVLGSAFDDHLTGNGADNWLLGGAGADVMTGGLGNDTYAVDDQHDQVIENAGEGIDAVHSYLASYTLGANIENLKLDGAASAGVGNGLGNRIEGNDLDNFIDGKGGVDVMVGGDGNDTYIVDNPADVVIEQGDSDSPPVETFGEDSAGINAAPASSHGVDAVWAFTSYTLADNVEILVLGGHGDIDGTGNALDNVIVGNGGDNHIDGGAGGDLMMGGEGDDTYAVDNILDRVAEKAGQGIDTVNSTISAGLTDDVENLNLVGPGNLNALGNGGANTIVGNDGDNALDGAGGADTLTGGLGNDAFVFGRGQANGDTVTDFDGHGAAAGDVLIFSGYGAGATFTNIDATHWQVNYDGGAQHDVITFSNAASIHVNDVLFV